MVHIQVRKKTICDVDDVLQVQAGRNVRGRVRVKMCTFSRFNMDGNVGKMPGGKECEFLSLIAGLWKLRDWKRTERIIVH